MNKQQLVERAVWHQEQDSYRRGFYWKPEEQKGCAIGCLAHSNENAHEELEGMTGIPIWLSKVVDTLFEGMSLRKSKKFTVKIADAMPKRVFKDHPQQWSTLQIDKRIKAPFLILVLESVLDTFDHAKHPDVKVAIDGSIALWERDDIGSDDWEAAAEAAADAAEAAAWAAAWAAEAAARAAAWAAARAAAEAAAWAAAEAAKYDYFADKLIDILRAAESGE